MFFFSEIAICLYDRRIRYRNRIAESLKLMTITTGQQNNRVRIG